jgi:hypothetical protein
MAGMSFDDVSYVIEEEPEPPRRPRRFWRIGLVGVATALSMGAVVAGASALTDNGAARQERRIVPHHATFRHFHRGPCPNMSRPPGASIDGSFGTSTPNVNY